MTASRKPLYQMTEEELTKLINSIDTRGYRAKVSALRRKLKALSSVVSLTLIHDPDLKDRLGARGATKAWSAFAKLNAAAHGLRKGSR